MSVRGKVVLKGHLVYRRKGSSSYKKRFVTAYCGVGAGENGGKTAVAILTVNEDNDKVEKPGQKPKNMISLEGANIECSYTSNSASGVYSNAGRLSASPSPSPHNSGSGIITSGSGSGSGIIISNQMQHPFSVVTKNGDVHEFRSESDNERLRWVKLLQLLIMFPFSTIPDEPTTKPFRESLRSSNLDPKKYGADSVWTVYILPEEVGSRCSIIGINVVALKSGKKDVSIGRLDIYNLGDPSTPVISWDRDKMRRTGKTGHLVFIEIGRRCEGGPGLVWMYTGFNEAQSLRETLHNFLFKGDGRAVAIPTQSPPLYDVPRSSMDTSLPPSYKRHNSIPGYDNHVLSRSRSHDHDSGYPPSPFSSMTTSPQLDGPPVRLDKHPSIRRRSGGRDISRSNSTTSFGSLSDRELSFGRSRDSAVDLPVEGTGSGDNSRSNSPQDEDESVIGQMDPLQPPSSNGVPYYDSVPRRSSSDGLIVNGQQRVVLTGGGPAYYEQMVHPRNSTMQGYDGYVLMKPAENGRATSAPIPVASRNGSLPADDTYHHLQRLHSPQQNSSSPKSRNNYDQLPTISEGRRSNYENHPLPRDLKGASVEYRPSYENVEKAQGRRGSLNQDHYEDVDGERSPCQNSNSNNGNSGGQKKRLSLRRRSSEKGGRGDVVSPVSNGSGDIESYVVIQSKSENGRVNSSVPAVGYASMDYQHTDVVGTMRNERGVHGQYHRSQVVYSEH